MVIDHRLDFGAVHILTAAKDHVFLAVHQIEEFIFIYAADIACMQPTVSDGFGCCFRAVDVALDHG